ncbi:MAG: radical SAM protein [Deltaproteobacteria bacterium]|nr:radical SAM protein [Deltaproteobacteria bacterium]
MKEANLSAQSAWEEVYRIYWVFTQRCNDFCAHCYNDSGPNGKTLSAEEISRIVSNLPDRLYRIILSGGEPFAERKKLTSLLKELREKYGKTLHISVQTNGDLLRDQDFDEIILPFVNQISIASLDRFHKQQGMHQERLAVLFERFGLIPKAAGTSEHLTYSFFGANEEYWLGGNWYRGRAAINQLALMDPNHNFCALRSGAKNFLARGEETQEITIQLYEVHPCCPGTKKALGDAREKRISSLLERAAKIPLWQALHRGEPAEMGFNQGLSLKYANARIEDLGNVCRWCDEFFANHNKDGEK